MRAKARVAPLYSVGLSLGPDHEVGRGLNVLHSSRPLHITDVPWNSSNQCQGPVIRTTGL
jgi:hypothetical protein